MNNEKPEEQPQPAPGQSEHVQIIDEIVNALIKLDQTDGPVRSLLQVTAQRLERNPAHAFKNNLAIYAVTLIVLFGLGFLTWYEKIDSDALMVLVGLVLGILSNYVKGIFRTN